MNRCAHPTCTTSVQKDVFCVIHGGNDSAIRTSPEAFAQGLPNPWAAVSPECPNGHHARRVYRWSYDAGDPWPWLCVECGRRFA